MRWVFRDLPDDFIEVQRRCEAVARDVFDVYAPLAHRLGIGHLKWELEDLSFATLHPKMYEEIARLVGQRAPAREQYIERVIGEIEGKLRALLLARPERAVEEEALEAEA